MDSYQPIYDAARSKIDRVDGEQIVQAAREAFDISYARAMLQEQIYATGTEITRPSVLFRPTVAPDGDKWRALYGPDLMEGVSGFGDTPDEAMRDFDKNWTTLKTPTAIRTSKSEQPRAAYRSTSDE